MAGRWGGRVVLSSGLLAATLLGGAGGYGAGLVTAPGIAIAGEALPLSPVGTSTTTATTANTPTQTPPVTPPPKKAVPDDSPALLPENLTYQTRTFTAVSVLKSVVSVSVPSNWSLTQPGPPTLGRYTDPTTKRWIRIEAGFTIRRLPADSMAARIKALDDVPKDQVVTILSEHVDPLTKDATLTYTYIPDKWLRRVIVRWVANDDGLCEFEMAATGLPQDKAALVAVLDRATKTATRTDAPL